MIYDKLENIGLYFDPDSDFVKAVEFAKQFSGENGKYPLDGDRVYASVHEYITGQESEKVFEAHRKYIDVQIMITGSEMHGVMPLDDSNLSVTEDYDSTRDVIFFDTISDYTKVILSSGEFVVYYPSDCHKPGCSIDHDTQVRKIVVKIALSV